MNKIQLIEYKLVGGSYMFMVFSKEKILSYLISLSTVALLFVLSFAITKRNDEIIKTSANVVTTNSVDNSEVYDSGMNPNEEGYQNIVKTNGEVKNDTIEKNINSVSK